MSLSTWVMSLHAYDSEYANCKLESCDIHVRYVSIFDEWCICIYVRQQLRWVQARVWSLYVCVMPLYPMSCVSICMVYTWGRVSIYTNHVSMHWSQEPLPPGGGSYLLGSLIKNLEEEDPPRSTWYKFFEGGPLPPGSWLGNLTNWKPPPGGGVLRSIHMTAITLDAN